jgi:hypothetical protein
MSLTLLELSDRELLLVLRDCAGPGYATAAQIAERMDMTDGHRSVSCRLSWLVRYGAVEREYQRDAMGQIRYRRNGKVMYAQGWRLTFDGLTMATGKLGKQAEAQLERLTDGQTLMTARWLTRRIVESDRTAAVLIDREYRHGIGRR